MRSHRPSLSCPKCAGVCFALPGGEIELKTIVECLACGTFTLYADLRRSEDHHWPVKSWAPRVGNLRILETVSALSRIGRDF
jgi:hypothetical protein